MVSRSYRKNTDDTAAKRRVRYGSYSEGYDPKAVEHDLLTIRQLMKGRKKITMQLAQEIYYKIKSENIQFRSDTGEDFLHKLLRNMTQAQVREIDKTVQRKKQRRNQKKQLLRINKKIIVGMFTIQLILCVVFLNWNLILDFRTNYETSRLQAKIGSQNTDSAKTAVQPVNAGTEQEVQAAEVGITQEPQRTGTEQERQTVAGTKQEAQQTETEQEVQATKAGTEQEGQVINTGTTQSSQQTMQSANAQVNQNEKTATEQENSRITPAILEKFRVLYYENPDFAGWLKIGGTKIDYPVMSRAGDNNYYLDKNFTHQKDKNGLLILDYRSDVLAEKQNIIIYGHNMRTGVMFGTLKQYKDKNFCEAHPTIQFDSLYEEGEYQVVAALLSEVAYEDEDVFRYYDAIDISTEESFQAFKENIYQNAIYTIGDELQYGDSCLVLSTCDNYKEDGRFVVVAKKKKYL